MPERVKFEDMLVNLRRVESENCHVNLRRAEGESLWQLGKQTEAEAIYQALVDKLPDQGGRRCASEPRR